MPAWDPHSHSASALRALAQAFVTVTTKSRKEALQTKSGGRESRQVLTLTRPLNTFKKLRTMEMILRETVTSL